jgi:predicted XRE-type DNA-binding protein
MVKNDEGLGSIPEGIPILIGEGSRQVDLDPRTKLGLKLREILIEKQLKQREVARLLAIQQPEVSHLLNGHFSRFTTDKLIRLLYRLGWKVEFQIHPYKVNKI